ncbi:AsmA-like C-terminal region-containing protein [Humitalea sp. 24SJ18S-53]|uniref:YhdP family protein n=1 Tax=Humitalea sp. 24SJ18S-53 TaxID=3422307 RepID=UPI003D66DF00
MSLATVCGAAIRLAMASAILLGLAIGGLAWRLNDGPLELPWVTEGLREALDGRTGTLRVELAGVSLAWAGFRDGHLSPLALRATGLSLGNAEGQVIAQVPAADIAVSLPWLLRGQVAVSALDLEGPVLMLRGDDVGVLEGGSAAGVSPSGGAPAPTTPADVWRLLSAVLDPKTPTPLDALQRLRMTGGRVELRDAAGATLAQAGAIALTARRGPAGGLALEGSATFGIGAARTVAKLAATAAGQPLRATGWVDLAEVSPAFMEAAAAAGWLPPPRVLDATIALRLTMQATEATGIAYGIATSIGRGRVVAGVDAEGMPQSLMLASASARIDGTIDAAGQAQAIVLTTAAVRLGAIPREGGGAEVRAPTLTASGRVWREGGGWNGSLDLGLDRLNMGDLSAYWPPGVVEGARWWVVENVVAGTATGGRWHIEGAWAEGAASPGVTAVNGTLPFSDARIHWLRPIPPAEAASGTITFGLREIVVQARARQAGTALDVRDVTVRLTDLGGVEERAAIEARVLGPVADVVTLIKHPRLGLFTRQPLDLKSPGGTADARLTVGFPLLGDLPMERLDIRATARLTQARLADVLFGQGFDRGTFDLVVDPASLRLTGTATFAEMPVRAQVEMDFRAGPASQIVARERVEVRPDARQVGVTGMDVTDFASGPIALVVQTERRRDGGGRVAVRGDLRDAVLFVEPIGWIKPAGDAAALEANLILTANALSAVEGLRVSGPGISVRGRAVFGRASRLDRLEITEAQLGANRLSGEMRPPSGVGQPWRLTVAGSVLDAAPMLHSPPAGAAPVAVPPPSAGTRPPVVLDLRLDQVALSRGRRLTGLAGSLSFDGSGAVTRARLTGGVPPAQGSGAPGGFTVAVTPEGRSRQVALTSENAGELLHALDVMDYLEGGRLTVNGNWPLGEGAGPFVGSADMNDFAVRGAPGLGKLLQAMTLFGLFDALRGAGLHFDRMVAPFSYDGTSLVLTDARAFSSSLGVTARGRVDRRRRTIDAQGTVVPAYMINSLLGNIPLLGRLFSPETGGGLFAATWRMTGPMDDPQVSVNPLAALTPGFLRGIFGGGDAAAPAPPPVR